jgi:hypothetical protein
MLGATPGEQVRYRSKSRRRRPRGSAAEGDPNVTFDRVPSCKRRSYSSLVLVLLFDHLVMTSSTGRGPPFQDRSLAACFTPA